MSDKNGEECWYALKVFYNRVFELEKQLSQEGVRSYIPLLREEIATGSIPPHKQECYKEWNELTLPITEKIHNEELSLPMSPVMTEKEIKEVVEAINYFK